MTSWESGRQPRPAPKAGAKPTGTGGLGSIGEAANPAVPRGVLQAAQTDLVDAAVDRAAPPAAPTAPLRGGAPSSVAQSAEKSCARKFAPVRASEALSDRQKPIGKSAASALLQAISWAVDRHKEISCLPPSAVTDTDELSDGGSRDTVHGERRSTQWSVDDAGDTGLPRRLAAVHGESRLGDAQDLTNTSRERGPGHDPSARASVRRNDKTEPSFPGPQTYPRTLADGPDDGLEVSRGQGTERVATAPGEPEEPQAGGRSCPLPPVPQSQQPHQQKLFADPEGQDRRGAVETPLPASPSAARSQGGMRQPQPYAGPAVPEQSRGAPDAVSVEGGAKHKEIGPGNQESAAPRAKPHEVTGTDEEGEKLRSNIIRALKPLVVQNMEKFLSEGQPEGTPDAPAVEISVFAQGQKTCAADSEQNSKISDKEALPGIQSVSSLLTTQMVMQAKGINGAGRAYGTTDAQPMSWAADDPISLSANMEAFDKARGMMGSLKARGAEKAWLESGGAQGFASLGHDAVRTIAACCASHQSVDDRAAALEDGGYAAWREDTRSSAEESEGRASSGSNVAPGPVEARDQSFESCIESPARGDLDTTARQKAAVFAMSDLSQIGISSVTQTFSADLDSASQLELDADVGTSRTRASRHTDSTADRELASDLERQSSPELIKPGCEHDATQDQRDCDDPHAESRRGFSVPTPRPCTSPARGGSSAKSQKPTGTERGPGSKTQTRDGEGNGAGVALADRSLAWLSARSVEFLANISQISRCSIDGSDSRPLRGNIGASQDNQIDGSRIHFLPASIDLHDTAAEGQKEKDSAIQQEDSGSFFSSANTSGAHDLHWTRRADDSSTERCWYEHMEEWYGLKLRSASSPAIGCRTSDSFRVEVLRNSIGHIPLNAAELPSPFSLSAARRYKDAATPLDVDGCHPELVQCVDGGLSPRISGVVPLGMGMAKGLSAGDDRARAPARLRQSRGRKLDSSSSDLRQRAEAICNGMVCAVIGCVVASGALGSMDKKLQDANDEGAGQSSDDSLTRIGSMVDADSSGAMNESASYVSAPHPQPSAVWLNEPRQDEEARTSAEHGMPRSGPASPNVPLAEIVMTEFGSGGVASLSLPLPFEFDQPIPAWIPPPPHLSLGGQAWDTFNSGHVPLASAHSHSVSVPYDFPGADFVPGLPYDDDSPTASCNQSDPIHTSGGQGAGGLTGSKPLRKDSPYRRLKRFFSGALSSPGSNKDAGGNPPRKGQHRKSR